ncbi:unnamed protein product, partial [Amoebophrya sp. A25]
SSESRTSAGLKDTFSSEQSTKSACAGFRDISSETEPRKKGGVKDNSCDKTSRPALLPSYTCSCSSWFYLCRGSAQGLDSPRSPQNLSEDDTL